ncbi:hypothetical protein P3X46_006354 [Hevea brasiliensis]|uniref:non-specific serine/threonine protein kinase n=1 Tax=Hevea brasiliensis TaxID=3981 RepID=A0ABQ9MTT5_HEVBR|nr:hypothetical protein P3X46_006354 [Hevea brasiliensis]
MHATLTPTNPTAKAMALIKQLPFILTIFIVLLFSSNVVLASLLQRSIKGQEAESLLKWKDSLDEPTNCLLCSWNFVPRNSTSSDPKTDISSSPCQWIGIACDESGNVIYINVSFSGLRGTLQSFNFSSFPSLERLDLSHNFLHGSIPSRISNLSKLIYLDLAVNNFSGNIPSEIGMLKSLVVLEIGMLTSLNVLALTNNSLTGPIPATVGNTKRLTWLYIANNKLSGFIPKELGSLTCLSELSLHSNSLQGPIPASIGNLSNLKFLDLGFNNLSGSIPPEVLLLKSLDRIGLNDNGLTGSIPTSIANLGSMRFLYLYDNHLSGPIPQELGKLQSLIELDLSTNDLSGPIPPAIGNLSNLTLLYLHKNMLSGSIPSTIGNLTKLRELELSINHFSGQIPPEVGKLKYLTDLRLFMNNLSGPIPQEINNFTSLKSLQLADNMLSGHIPQNICLGGVLEIFVIGNNSFVGSIPKSLKNCTSLIRVKLERNQLDGHISEDFGIYPNLKFIDLSYNNLHGELSNNWGHCHNLTFLKFSNNRISGGIPPEVGKANQLQVLDLSTNCLVGKIPKELGELKLLFNLKLNNNKLSGNIPSEIGMLSKLTDLSLAANDLRGPIPELKDCSKLQLLNLSKNRLSESVPFQVGRFLFLQDLDLSHNLLEGEIPSELGYLLDLETLNLSHNELSGSIPSTFNEMLSLTIVDISFNQLEGPLPNNKAFSWAPIIALSNNKGLCGNNSGFKACPCTKISGMCRKDGNKAIVFIAVSLSSTLVLLFVISGVLVIVGKRARKIDEAKEAGNENIFSTCSYDGKMVHENIIAATEGFNSKYCIGVGGCGTVYRVELPTGQVVAVKKLHQFEGSEISNLKAFTSEICALTNIKHRNIVKLHGFCLHSQHSYLVYEFLGGGSLGKILQERVKAEELKWIARLNIVKGVASALSYMHHDCSPPIVHRDISSNNILMDLEQEAYISDFGTARFLMLDSTHWTSFAGTFGYLAPELAYSMEANEKGDVYSFGVVSLEVIMGRHPGDIIMSLSTSTLSDTCQILLKDILDQRLPLPTNKEAAEVVSIVKLAFACLHANPGSRPTMQQVSQKLSVKVRALWKPLRMLTLGELL